MFKFFLAEFEQIKNHLKLRNVNEHKLLLIKTKLEQKNRLIKEVNQLRKERNQLSSEKQFALENKGKSKKIREKIVLQEKLLSNLEAELQVLMAEIPNLPAEGTPSENRIVDEFKYEHKINHQLTHEQIARKLNIINEKASIKLSGGKFAVYQGLGAQLVNILTNFMLVEQQKRGYQLFNVPYLVKNTNLYHTGQLPKFQEDLFKIKDSNLYLIPTAEVPLVNLYQDEILDEKSLPLKTCAYSACFRAEAGAAGQEDKGLIRLHQFHKVELVRIVSPEDSYQHLREIVRDSQNILRLLNIPHRVVELSYSELGFSAAKTYDIEVWLPVSKRWLEVSSCSNCGDFQTERAQIRVKKRDGSKYYPHSLNGSGLAIDRLIVVLLEYYYENDKTKLNIPEKIKELKLSLDH